MVKWHHRTHTHTHTLAHMTATPNQPKIDISKRERIYLLHSHSTHNLDTESTRCRKSHSTHTQLTRYFQFEPKDNKCKRPPSNGLDTIFVRDKKIRWFLPLSVEQWHCSRNFPETIITSDTTVCHHYRSSCCAQNQHALVFGCAWEWMSEWALRAHTLENSLSYLKRMSYNYCE